MFFSLELGLATNCCTDCLHTFTAEIKLVQITLYIALSPAGVNNVRG
jgi:hypothetical protein